jgi:cell division septation protein DedD
MRKAKTTFLLVGALFTLSGCVLPPVVTVASYAVDIVTYEATGKTATDHVYSAAARSDCSFVRVLRRKPICVDPPALVADTSAAPQTNDAEPKALSTGTAALPAAQSQKARVIIGSFVNLANAERSVARYADWHPVITNVTVDGRHFHRVVAGSLSAAEAAALKAKLAADQPARLRLAQS